MDYQWWVFLHVFGAFVFVAAHGASALVAFRIREVRDPAGIRTLLDVSQAAIGAMYGGLLLLLVGGIAAGLAGDHFSRGWIWAAIVLLVATMVAMYMLATPFYRRFRLAVGAETGGRGPAESAGLASQAEVEALARSSRPITLAAVGLIGFVVILWLMFFKPF
jgi:hypothetical protein